MARRLSFDPIAARREAAQQLRDRLSNIDLAELQAQTYAPQMVDFLAGMALDPTIEAKDLPVLKFKRDLAKDVLERAYGMPATKMNVTVHRQEDLAPDSQIVAEIEAARLQATEFRQIADFLQQSPEQWPDWMRERFLASGTAYVVEDDGEAVLTQAKQAAD